MKQKSLKFQIHIVGLRGLATIVCAVVVDQLVEQLLPTPEICSLYPSIGKVLFTICTFNFEKTKIGSP